MFKPKSMSTALLAWKNQGIFLTVGAFDHRVFVVDIGDKEASAADTLILMHGFPESSYSFSGTISYLQSRFKRIVCWDSLGFGFSDKPDEKFTYSIYEHVDVALEVWKQLGICGAHVIAHDMGDTLFTEILCRIHHNRPYWMTAGILSATFTNGGMVIKHTHMRLGQLILLSPLKNVAATILGGNYNIFKSQILSANGNKNLTNENIESMFSQFFDDKPKAVIWKVVQYYKERSRFEHVRWLPILSQLDIPIHIAWGLDDKNNVSETALYIKENIAPQANISLMKGLGHFCQIQNPQLWSDYMLGFLESIKN